METNIIGNHVTGELYFLCTDTYTHISLFYAFGNELLTILDLVHKLWNQTYFILLELLQSWLLSQNTLGAIITAHSNKLRCQKKINCAQLQKLRHRSCMQDGGEEGVERTPCWTGYKYITFPSLLHHLVSENINSRKLLGFAQDIWKPEINYKLCNTVC